MKERAFSDRSYEEFLKEEKLMGSRCKRCGALYVPPRALCTKCFNTEMEWEEMKGKGRLIAFTCISVAPPSMMKQGYNRNNPYCSGVIELEEGAKVDARIEGVDVKDPENIKIGTEMKVKFIHITDGKEEETYLAFEPV